MISDEVGVVDFPTLGHLADWWVERHCTVPDGPTRGKPFKKADWQFWVTANRYRVREDAVFVPFDEVGPDCPAVLGDAFTYRMTMVVAPQKTGKGPNSAADTSFEAVGPSVFAGWAEPGDVYLCSDNDCECGGVFEYEPGEPMGMRHPSPLIQLTATSEDQVDNIYRPLSAMIRRGPLTKLLARREGFIRIFGGDGGDDGDKIDRVTSQARSKLGNPISDAEQDEVGLWTKANGLLEVGETQARGAAGMQGRVHATTNAWDPSANSYAQQIYEANEDDVFIFYRNPNKNPALLDELGRPLSFLDPEHRRKILEFVYEGSWWVSIDSIERLAKATVKTDPAQAERFFGNRLVTGSSIWLPLGVWDARKSPLSIALRTQLVLGFDGSDIDDWTGIRAETRDGYQFTPETDDGLTIWNPADHDGQVPRLEVSEAVDWLFKNYDIVRMYADPPYWTTEVDGWAAKYGDTKVLRWYTNRPRPMTAAAERLLVDISKDETKFTHDGCEHTSDHMRAAQKIQKPTSTLYKLGKPGDGRKIDLAVCSILAHEAAGDATAAKLWRAPARPRRMAVIR